MNAETVGTMRLKVFPISNLGFYLIIFTLTIFLLYLQAKISNAQTTEIDKLKKQAQRLRESIYRPEIKYCLYSIKNQRLNVKHGMRPSNISPATLGCPDIYSANAGQWDEYVRINYKIYSQLEKLNRQHKKNKYTFLSQVKYEVGYVLACDFARVQRYGNTSIFGLDTIELYHKTRNLLNGASEQANLSDDMDLAQKTRYLSGLLKIMYNDAKDSKTDFVKSLTGNEICRQQVSREINSADLSPAERSQEKIAVPQPVVLRGREGYGSKEPIPKDMWEIIRRKYWRKGCADYDDLYLLKIPYKDFSGIARSGKEAGEMIVARDVADDVLQVFHNLYLSGFAIDKMVPIHEDKYAGNDSKSMEDNNTSAFNCRAVTAGRRLSEHSFGLAIDINPVQNPFVRGTNVMPRHGTAFRFARPKNRNKSTDQLGLILRDGVVVKAFKEIGWKWGGDWKSVKDYQHFSKSGR